MDVCAPPCAPLAIRTYYSSGEGSASPADWAHPLAGRRVVLADREDLRSLPVCLVAWGRPNVIPGCTVRMGPADVLLIAQDGTGYRNLCRYLSARMEHTDENWPESGTMFLPDLSGLLALTRDDGLADLLGAAGALPFFHATSSAEPISSRHPALLLPVASHLDDAGRRGDPIRRALAARQGRPLPEYAVTLPEALAAAQPCEAGERAAAVLSSCTPLPPLPRHRGTIPGQRGALSPRDQVAIVIRVQGREYDPEDRHGVAYQGDADRWAALPCQEVRCAVKRVDQPPVGAAASARKGTKLLAGHCGPTDESDQDFADDGLGLGVHLRMPTEPAWTTRPVKLPANQFTCRLRRTDDVGQDRRKVYLLGHVNSPKVAIQHAGKGFGSQATVIVVAQTYSRFNAADRSTSTHLPRPA